MTTPDPVELRDVAVAIAEEAGTILRDGLHRVRRLVETKSSATDMVTEIDHASEALIAQRLSERRPDDGQTGEEGTSIESSSGVEWVFDPLDGTTNYLYGYSYFAVAIAAFVDGLAVAGAVHDPVHLETYSAARGAGSTRNGEILQLRHPTPALASALVGTGFAYAPATRARQAALLPHVLPAVRDIRRGGAAALDHCWVAAGRLDAFYEWGLGQWDWAAGSLVAEEAGYRTGVLDDGTRVVAAPRLFDDLVDLITTATARDASGE